MAFFTFQVGLLTAAELGALFGISYLPGGLLTAAELGALCGISFPSPSPLSSSGIGSVSSRPSTGVLSFGPLFTRLGVSISGGLTCLDTVKNIQGCFGQS